MTTRSQVYLKDLTSGYSSAIAEGLQAVGFFDQLSSGATVFLKPNLTYPEYRPGVMTSFECIKAVTECLIDHGYKVIIGEAEGGGYNQFSMDAVFECLGINELARRTGARLVNMSFAEAEILRFKVGFRNVSVPIPKLLLHEIDAFITIPVPKIHMNTLVSLSIKNQWGCIQEPSERLKLHPFFAEVMYQLNRRLPKAHSIIDGRIGLNRSGPLRGDPVALNWLLVSNDLVAADRVTCRLMQIPEEKVKYLQYFRKQGWWTPFSEIQVNADLDQFKKTPFYLSREWTDWPGVACFNNSILAWLGYHSPLAGFAHWLLYRFREPFYDHAEEKKKLQRKEGNSRR